MVLALIACTNRVTHEQGQVWHSDTSSTHGEDQVWHSHTSLTKVYLREPCHRTKEESVSKCQT
jgi:hypothetical protein